MRRSGHIHPSLVDIAKRHPNVNAVKWFTVMDGRGCPTCAELHDLVWRLDGKPVGHNLSLPKPPPATCRHCRCLLLPMKYGPDIPFPDGSTE